MPKRIVRACCWLPFLVLCLAPPVRAADDGETIVMAKETVEAVNAARKAKDGDALTTAYARLIELHNGMEGTSWRKKLQVAVGAVLRDKKCKHLHEGALGALEELDDGDGVLAQLKAVLPKPGDVEVDELGVQAVEIIGKVKSTKGVKTLHSLAMKSKNMDVRVAAVETQSNYRHAEQSRVKVLGNLLTVLVSLQPREGQTPTEAQQVARDNLQQPVVDTLDRLTRLKLETNAAWLAWYADNKSKLKKVFD